MGTHTLPAPPEGMLFLVLVCIAVFISTVRSILRAPIELIGKGLSYFLLLDSSENPSESDVEEVRNWFPATRFDSVCDCKVAQDDQNHEHECSICLTQFEPESEVNHLCCGHVFHKMCLDKWLSLCNITCPLCRTSLVPQVYSSPTW